MLPRVKFEKSDGNTGVVRPGATGIIVCIAPAEDGPTLQAQGHTSDKKLLEVFKRGPLAELGSYVMAVGGNPIVAIRAEADTPGAYGTIDTTGVVGGSSVVSNGSSEPLDDFKVYVTVTEDGDVGTSVKYRYSLDGGATLSPVQEETTTTLDIPNSGVSFTLGAGDLKAGDNWSVSTTGAKMSSTNVSDALEALRVSTLPYEGLIVHVEADSTIVGLLDQWTAAREPQGKFKYFLTNARMRDVGEEDADYQTAMSAAFSSVATIRGCVGADGGNHVETLRGITQARPTSWGIAGRAAAKQIAVDPAYVADGAIPGFSVADVRGNLEFHDEAIDPGLDDVRLSTFRTWNNRSGTYLTNARVLSAEGSDYVYLQHIRVMNRACEIAYELLTESLSLGVRKQKDGNLVRIKEEDALLIEERVNAAVRQALKGQVTDVLFTLSRTDDIGSNAGAIVNASLEVEALAYIKEFDVISRFTRSITARA